MKRAGQVVLGLSLVAAVLGGIDLSRSVASAEQNLAAIAPFAGVWLIAVTALAGVGIFLYQRGDLEAAPVRSETELQRRLADALGGGNRVTFQVLAEALDTDAQAVARLISELTRLEVMPAAVNWDSGIIYPRNRGYLATLRVCLHCGEALIPEPKSVTCGVCRTVHYDV